MRTLVAVYGPNRIGSLGKLASRERPENGLFGFAASALPTVLLCLIDI